VSPADIAARLVSAWRRVHGQAVAVESLQALSAGASARTYKFELLRGGQRELCILQMFAGGEQFVGALDKHDQARVQQAAAAAGIATPAVLLTVGPGDGLAEGFVSRFTAGETLGKRIVGEARLAQARQRLAGQCAQALAGIHALDSTALSFLPLRSAESQLRELAGTHRALGEALPVFEAALAWLDAHCPAAVPPCVVHGDFRTGNLLVDEQGLAGVLDWELAHLGDPLEDLGWLCMRSWRFGRDDLPAGGFAPRAAFYGAYEAASGSVVNALAVRFWEMLGTLKWGLICQWFAHRRLERSITTLEPAVIGRRVSEVELQLLDLIEARGA
jgi:aminoglycoside phosphotransferase (APT) family kinase protein